MYGLDDVKDSIKGNLMSKVYPVLMFVWEVIGINPKQRGYFHDINSPKEGLLDKKYLATPVHLCPLGELKEDIGRILFSESLEVHMGKYHLKYLLNSIKSHVGAIWVLALNLSIALYFSIGLSVTFN